MESDYPELHTCLSFMALPHEKLVPTFQACTFAWGQGHIETKISLAVIALILSEESTRRFQDETTDQALAGIFAILELMDAEPTSCVWSAPGCWADTDRGFMGTPDVWDGLRQLSLLALRSLNWTIEWPLISYEDLLATTAVAVEKGT